MKEKLSEVYWPLRLAYGLVPLLAGLDKYTNILADWQRYVSPMTASLLPMSVQTFMHIVGMVEIVVGLAVLLGFTRLGGLVVVTWLALISINLVLAGYFDIAVRDLVMSVGAYTLSMVAAERGEEFVRSEFCHERRSASCTSISHGGNHTKIEVSFHGGSSRCSVGSRTD